MVTLHDERNGLVKLSWAEVRERVAKVEPQFAKLVDAISPDKSFAVYLAYYPFGAMIGDTASAFFPDKNGELYRPNKNNLPKDAYKNLGYGLNSIPLGLVLEKQVELYLDLEKSKITIPWVLLKAGTLFPFNRILSYKSKHIYAPSSLLCAVAGSRSTFMLPNIGCHEDHSNLQHYFGINERTPKNLYDHWHIFKSIAASQKEDPWRCCILYFSEKWVTSLHSDPAWSELKKYLHELSWSLFEYQRNKIHYDLFFSLMQEKNNLKPNPYHIDTIKHLFAIALGAALGFVPAIDNSALPLELIVAAYIDYYGLKKYFPTIMVPQYFQFHTQYPVYYSMQNPSTYIFSPKSREITNTLLEMRELHRLTKIFIQELHNENSPCSETVLSYIAKNIDFNFYHNVHDKFHIIQSTDKIPKIDPRFKMMNKKLKQAVFSADAPFLRGCISISQK